MYLDKVFILADQKYRAKSIYNNLPLPLFSRAGHEGASFNVFAGCSSGTPMGIH